MSKEKDILKKAISKSALTGRFVKNPAKSGSIQLTRVDKAVKKVAGSRTGTVRNPNA